MLTLIYGPSTLVMDYIESLAHQIDILLTMCENKNVKNVGIDVELSVKNSSRIIILFQRLFSLRGEDLKVISTSISHCKSLKSLIEDLSEYSTYYNAYNLQFHIQILKNLDIWHKPEIQKFLKVPVFEPYRTFTCIIYALWLLDNASHDVTIALPIDLVDEVYDYLILFKNFKKAIIYSFIKPKNIHVFDSIDEISTSFKLRTLTMCKVTDDIYLRDLKLLSDDVWKLLLEILEIIDEFGYTTLNALKDIAAQSLGIDKDLFRSLIHKLQSMDLINIRYLSDGRVVINLTPQAYYWLSKGKNNDSKHLNS